MSDELRDPLRAMKDPGPDTAQVADDCQQRQQRQQVAEAMLGLGVFLRVTLLGYAAWLWWGWRGMVSALAVYFLVARLIVCLGWLIACGRRE